MSNPKSLAAVKVNKAKTHEKPNDKAFPKLIQYIQSSKKQGRKLTFSEASKKTVTPIKEQISFNDNIDLSAARFY